MHLVLKHKYLRHIDSNGHVPIEFVYTVVKHGHLRIPTLFDTHWTYSDGSDGLWQTIL